LIMVIRFNFFPLIIAMVLIIDNCNPVIIGISPTGTGVAPIKPFVVITLLPIVLANFFCTLLILDNLATITCASFCNFVIKYSNRTSILKRRSYTTYPDSYSKYALVGMTFIGVAI